MTRYLKNRWDSGSAAFELKITHTPSLPFDSVKPHQIAALRIAKHGTLVYKIPDTGYDQKPFDTFVLTRSEAYVAVMFYQRGCNHFYLIDVDDFLKEQARSKRKSLTEERAGAVGKRVVMEREDAKIGVRA